MVYVTEPAKANKGEVMARKPAEKIKMSDEGIASVLAPRVHKILGERAFHKLLGVPSENAWFVSEFARVLTAIKRKEDESNGEPANG